MTYLKILFFIIDFLCYNIAMEKEKVLTDKEQIILNKLIMLFVIEKMEMALTEDSILDI